MVPAPVEVHTHPEGQWSPNPRFGGNATSYVRGGDHLLHGQAIRGWTPNARFGGNDDGATFHSVSVQPVGGRMARRGSDRQAAIARTRRRQQGGAGALGSGVAGGSTALTTYSTTQGDAQLYKPTPRDSRSHHGFTQGGFTDPNSAHDARRASFGRQAQSGGDRFDAGWEEQLQLEAGADSPTGHPAPRAGLSSGLSYDTDGRTNKSSQRELYVGEEGEYRQDLEVAELVLQCVLEYVVYACGVCGQKWEDVLCTLMQSDCSLLPFPPSSLPPRSSLLLPPGKTTSAATRRRSGTTIVALGAAACASQGGYRREACSRGLGRRRRGAERPVTTTAPSRRTRTTGVAAGAGWGRCSRDRGIRGTRDCK